MKHSHQWFRLHDCYQCDICGVKREIWEITGIMPVVKKKRHLLPKFIRDILCSVRGYLYGWRSYHESNGSYYQSCKTKDIFFPIRWLNTLEIKLWRYNNAKLQRRLQR